MTRVANGNATHDSVGAVLHSAALYDLLVPLLTLGREGKFREKTLQLARLRPGETILDVGCGTGTLAIAAKHRVGPTGSVYGIDASPEMLARAEKKARNAGVEIALREALAQALPFPDGKFDAVLTTVMLHHVPRKSRDQCAAEMRRVLKPDGRVLAVEFGLSAREQKGLMSRLHRHGHVKLPDLMSLLSGAGLSVAESGSVGVLDLHFVLAFKRS